MIRWVFLDVGGVLLDEDVLTYHVFLRHARAIRQVRPDLTTVDLIAARETLSREGSRWPIFDLASAYLDPGHVTNIWEQTNREVRSHYGDFLPPIEGAVAAVHALSQHFRLGLIANQPSLVRGHLQDLEILAYFSVVCLSEELGHFKPDRRLFQTALKMAECPASEAAMIGDRMQNDIIPATELGMSTLLLRRKELGAEGDCDFATYRASLRRREQEEPLLIGRRADFEIQSLGHAIPILGVTEY